MIELLCGRAKLPAAAAAALCAHLSELGYKNVQDLGSAMAHDDAADIMKKSGLRGLQAIKFRRALKALLAVEDEESGLFGAARPKGGAHGGALTVLDEECVAFLTKVNLAEIFPRMKDEAGGTITIEEMCNSDFVSDKMLVDFELNKAQIRRFRRAVREHSDGAGASRRALAPWGAAEEGGAQARLDADTKAKAAADTGFGSGGAAEEEGGGEPAPAPKKEKRLRPSERRAAREAAREKEAALSEKNVPKDQFAATIDGDEEDPGTFL
jgi:hypothetical protein